MILQSLVSSTTAFAFQIDRSSRFFSSSTIPGIIIPTHLEPVSPYQYRQQHRWHPSSSPLSLFPETISNDMVQPLAAAAAAASSLELPTALAQSALVNQFTLMAQQGGPLVMTLAVAISDSVPLVPTQPISILAGALFGFQVGLPAVMLGQAMATLFAFFMGRYVLQPKSQLDDDNNYEKKKKKKSMSSKVQLVLQEMTSGLNSNDWKTVFWTIFVARQSPVIPFSLGNYFVGSATQAPFVPALLGTICGCLPLNCVWVGAGAGGMAAIDSLRSVTGGDDNDSSNLIGNLIVSNPQLAEGLEVVGVLATLAIVVTIGQAIAKVWQATENDDATDIDSVMIDKRT